MLQALKMLSTLGNETISLYKEDINLNEKNSIQNQSETFDSTVTLLLRQCFLLICNFAKTSLLILSFNRLKNYYHGIQC